MIGLVQARRLLSLMAAATAIALAFHPDSARCAEPPTQETTTRSASSDTQQGPDTVTIEAQRQRELKRQISKFVSSAVFTYMYDSLERWNTPICPLVAGLSKERGEFLLARVSQIARDSRAPLAAEHCKPNLFVVVTDNPDLLVEKWSKRDRGMLSSCNGMGYVKAFLHSGQPVRAYYNARFSSSDRVERDPSMLDVIGLHFDFSSNPCVAAGAAGSRLTYGAVQALTSVIIVVDSRRTTNLNMGQLADYVAMVGLAQIRADADTGTAPTILRLFREADLRPQGLSPWDQSFLYSLYTTRQSSVLEVTSIKARMFEQIVGR
jgi:hypothetical protein